MGQAIRTTYWEKQMIDKTKALSDSEVEFLTAIDVLVNKYFLTTDDSKLTLPQIQGCLQLQIHRVAKAFFDAAQVQIEAGSSGGGE